jgi:hypothetical protein
MAGPHLGVAGELRLELADPMLGSLPRLLQALLKGGIEDLWIGRPEGLELGGGLARWVAPRTVGGAR